MAEPCGSPPAANTLDSRERLQGVAPGGALRRIAFAASGLIPLLSFCGGTPDPMLLIYTVFVGAWLLRTRPARPSDRAPWPLLLKLLVLTLASGILTETLAWLGSFLAREREPALLHPQLLYDLLLSPGVYGGWAIAWLAALRLHRYSLTDVFVVQGVYGVFVEQLGAVFLQGLRALPFGVLLWGYVFIVYGSAMGLAYLPVERRLAASSPRSGPQRLPLALVLALLGTVISSLAWAAFLRLLGVVIPSPRPIWQAPLG